MGVKSRLGEHHNVVFRRILGAALYIVIGCAVLYFSTALLVFDYSLPALAFDNERYGGTPVAYGPMPRTFCCRASYHGIYFDGSEWVFKYYRPICTIWLYNYGYLKSIDIKERIDLSIIVACVLVTFSLNSIFMVLGKGSARYSLKAMTFFTYGICSVVAYFSLHSMFFALMLLMVIWMSSVLLKVANVYSVAAKEIVKPPEDPNEPK